jgi:hypothetical protein
LKGRNTVITLETQDEIESIKRTYKQKKERLFSWRFRFLGSEATEEQLVARLREVSHRIGYFNLYDAQELVENPHFRNLTCELSTLIGGLLFKAGILQLDGAPVDLPRAYAIQASGPQGEEGYSLYKPSELGDDLTEPMPFYPWTMIGDGFDEATEARLVWDVTDGWTEEIIRTVFGPEDF